MRRLIILTAFVGLALVPTMASAQQASIILNKKQSDELRRRADNEILLKIQGARLRKAGQTPAQKAAQAKADAEAAKRRKYKKNHRSLVADREHPVVKAESKPATKADP
jgi:hypothetical protein